MPRGLEDKELQRLIDLSEARGAIFTFCGIKMYGNKNPDPPEALAADIIHVRRIHVRLSKIRGLLISEVARDKLCEIGEKIEILNDWLEDALEVVKDAWKEQT